ncbi:hypothetical protein V8G57_09040 [Collimonas sp. H4R21]|uniref:Uncharacterized protein n=1 Tax=Collimonas rhizosphaerae TaxID=3126357 RepID=A0ABU9PU45_9BURK
MSDDLVTVEEFRHRRKVTWDRAKLWLAAIACGIIGTVLLADVDSNSSPVRFGASIFFFIIAGISSVRVIYIVRANYRCPICDAIPMDGGILLSPSIGYDEGIAINPKRCSGCGARLS